MNEHMDQMDIESSNLLMRAQLSRSQERNLYAEEVKKFAGDESSVGLSAGSSSNLMMGRK